MKKKLILGFMLAIGLAVILRADSTTTRAGLTKPSVGSANWGTKLNTNFDSIDSLFALQGSTNNFSVSQLFSGGMNVSSGTTTVYVTSTGVGIGTTTPQAMLHVGPVNDTSGTNATILAARAYTSSGNGHTYEDISTWAGSAGTSAASYDSRFTTIGTANYGHIVGYQTAMFHASAGTLDNFYGFGAFFTNNGGATANSYGLYAGEGAGTGTIANQYGLYVENLTKGTTNFAVYTVGSAPSSFGGQIRGANGASGAKIRGTITNDNASAGEYGEYKETLASTAGNVGTSGTVFDATSINLSSGDYNLSGSIIFRRNGATFTSTDLEIGISTTSGNSATGLVNNSNYFYDVGETPTAFTYHTLSIPSYRVSLAGSTTYYLKALVDVYTVGTPQYTAKISSVRHR